MKRLTRRQQEILSFIKAFIQEHAFPPTIREVADQFGISVKGGYDHIKAIEKKGCIRCTHNRSRAIVVLDQNQVKETGLRRIPIVGDVAAGKPLLAEENLEGDLELPYDMLGPGEFFAVNVKGDSMKDAGIVDGDIAVIRQQDMADNGEIVIAMVEDAFTLKRLYKERNRIKLKAENPAYPPIYTQNARILGKLCCLVRNY